MEGGRARRPHRRLVVAVAAIALAAGAAAAMLGVFGEDGSRTGGGRDGEQPTGAAFEGASCERFGRAAFSERLRRPTNLRVGPITFVSLGDYARAAASDFEPVGQALLRQPWAKRYVDDVVLREVREGSLYVAQKVIVVVEGGRDVTVAIPWSERGEASLLWGPQPNVTRSENALGLRQIPDGNPVVRFKGCDSKVMVYVGGGFVVAGKRCLPLDIWVDGREGPLRAVASFGAGARCSPRAGVGLTQ